MARMTVTRDGLGVKSLRALVMLATLVGFLSAIPAEAQTMLVSPFLQSATPTSVWVVWQTRFGRESTVEWGTTPKLGQTRQGTSQRMRLFQRRHAVELRQLKPYTRYYYRVRTGSLVSRTFALRTPPLPSQEKSFRVLVMSDMQRDGKHPSKYREVIERGVLRFAAQEYGESLEDAFGLVLFPGDLVRNGSRYRLWRNEFFAPTARLSANVPLYPALGNHEENSHYYFDYFHLPQNGTRGHLEHWWWFDYSNVRIIALDTNKDFRSEEQLAWLNRVLDGACHAQHVDFVVVQHHHPERSELWPRGDVPYVGRIARRLESFASRCHKPTTQFYGHTHAYARGHSRDAAHTMVNAASAGGDLDEYGEYAQRDYVEYVVSEAEYGFVVMEVEAGPAPKFRIRRVSLGDLRVQRANEVRDEVIVRRYNRAPEAPRPLTAIVPGDVSHAQLEVTPFVDRDGDAFGAVHWQVAGASCNFTRPVLDKWYQRHNHFGGVDTTRMLAPTRLALPPLPSNREYCYRVRHRDSSLSWSDWSLPAPFRTLDERLSARQE